MASLGVKHFNGFVERFHRTALDEVFRVVFGTEFYESMETLQADFDGWLGHYNTERPHLRYRNLGRRPIDTINLYRAIRANASQEA